MADLQTLLAAVDELSPQELIQLRDYVQQRTETIVWKLTSADLKTIDEAIAEVRDERNTKSRN